jgi:hypothetical protein
MDKCAGPASVYDESGRPQEPTAEQLYIRRAVGPTWEWSALAFVAAVAFSACLWFALEEGHEAQAAKLVELERRANAAEAALAALERPACEVWVRSIHEQPLAAKRCEEFKSAGIPGAVVEVDRTTYRTDEYGRVPIFRRDALVRVSARGFEPREIQITNCGDSFQALLRPANYMWPDPVVEVPLAWTRQGPAKGVWP